MTQMPEDVESTARLSALSFPPLWKPGLSSIRLGHQLYHRKPVRSHCKPITETPLYMPPWMASSTD